MFLLLCVGILKQNQKVFILLEIISQLILRIYMTTSVKSCMISHDSIVCVTVFVINAEKVFAISSGKTACPCQHSCSRLANPAIYEMDSTQDHQQYITNASHKAPLMRLDLFTPFGVALWFTFFAQTIWLRVANFFNHSVNQRRTQQQTQQQQCAIMSPVAEQWCVAWSFVWPVVILVWCVLCLADVQRHSARWFAVSFRSYEATKVECALCLYELLM